MCTAAVYRGGSVYMGRTLDYEFSYGEEVVFTPRGFPLPLRHGGGTAAARRRITRYSARRTWRTAIRFTTTR